MEKMMTKQEKEAIVKEMLGDMVDTCDSCKEKLGVWTTNPFLEDDTRYIQPAVSIPQIKEKTGP